MSVGFLFDTACEILVAANDGSIDFFHNNSLADRTSSRMRLFRSVKVSESRIIGLSLSPKRLPLPSYSSLNGTIDEGNRGYPPFSKKHEAQDLEIHLLLADGGYVVLELVTGEMVKSVSLPGNVSSTKPLLSAAWRMEKIIAVDAHGSNYGERQLCAVWGTAAGVFTARVDEILEQTERGTSDRNNKSIMVKIFDTKSPIPGAIISVGYELGVVCLGSLGQSFLLVSTAGVRNMHGAQSRIELPFKLRSVQVTPADETAPCGIACGGTMGELIYYTVSFTQIAGVVSTMKFHTFQDHWHHTPLSALGFSMDGRQLLSAGAEATLMSWEVQGNFAHRKILTPSNLGSAEANGALKGRFKPSTGQSRQNSGGGVITGPVLAIVSNRTNHSNVVLICADGQIVSVSLSEMRVISTAEGGRWTLSSYSNAPAIIEGLIEEAACISKKKEKSKETIVDTSAIDNEGDSMNHKYKKEESTAATNIFHSDIDKILAIQEAQLVQWRGHRAIMLVCNGNDPSIGMTGNSSIRICDIVTMEALHTLHVSYNAEAAASKLLLPSENDGERATSSVSQLHGLTLAAMADNGSLLVTYEYLTTLGLSSVLRFWHLKEDARQPGEGAVSGGAAGCRYVEVQQICAPQRDEIISMALEEGLSTSNDSSCSRRNRLFTLSRALVKCWQEVPVSAHEIGGHSLQPAEAARLVVGSSITIFNSFNNLKPSVPDASINAIWKAVASHRIGSGRAASLAISSDGSVLGVADDSVHLFDVRNVIHESINNNIIKNMTHKKGNAADAPHPQWDEILTLCQDRSVGALVELSIDTSSNQVIIARSLDNHEGSLFVWTLDALTSQWQLAVRSECLLAGIIEDQIYAVQIYDGASSSLSFARAEPAIVVNKLSRKTLKPESPTANEPQGLIDELKNYNIPSSLRDGFSRNPHLALKLMREIGQVSLKRLFCVKYGPHSVRLIVLDHTGLHIVAPFSMRDQEKNVNKKKKNENAVINFASLPASQRKTLEDFFYTPETHKGVSTEGDLVVDEDEVHRESQRSELLQKLLSGEAYTAPAISSILSAYLDAE